LRVGGRFSGFAGFSVGTARLGAFTITRFDGGRVKNVATKEKRAGQTVKIGATGVFVRRESDFKKGDS